MNTKIVIAATAVISFGAGMAAGWWFRKKQEITFEEVTEEEQQAYAAQFEKKMEKDAAKELEEKDYEQKPDDVENVPKIEVDKGEEGTNIHPSMDTRKQDYANAWKRDEIKQREGYGEPTPGDPEDLSPTKMDLDPNFEEAIRDEGPRFEPISGRDFYNDDDNEHVTVFWYDRDDVVTRLNEDDEEVVLDDPVKFLRGLDIRKEFKENISEAEEENAGDGLMLYRRDKHADTVIQLVRYPMSYGKRTQQEEYGGTDYLEWMHRRN